MDHKREIQSGRRMSWLNDVKNKLFKEKFKECGENMP